MRVYLSEISYGCDDGSGGIVAMIILWGFVRRVVEFELINVTLFVWDRRCIYTKISIASGTITR